MSGLTIGDIIFISVKPIFKIYLILFTGWLLVKYDILSMETSRGISNMAVNSLIPCLVFNKMVTNLSYKLIKDIGVSILTSLLISATGGFCALIVAKVSPVPKKWYWGLIFVGIFGNIADLPIAYVQSMGTGLIFSETDVDKGATLSCIFLALQTFLIQNVGMFQIIGLDFKEDIEEPVELIKPKGKETNEETIEIQSYRGSGSIRRIFSNQSQYSTRSRKVKQNTEAIINEYSEADLIRNQTIDELARTISKKQLIGLGPENEVELTKFQLFLNNYKLSWFIYILENSKRPASVVLLISLFVSLVPWVQALFVQNEIDIKEAPDELPILNFVMNYTAYLGDAAVPMGLLLLGGTIARLEINQVPKGFWKASLLMVFCRLCVLPIIGVLWVDRIYKDHWIKDDISRFILILTWAVPSSTAQVYYTAFYTPLEGEHLQMDCLAIFLILQYPILIVTLPIVVSFVLKVNLGL